MQDLSSKTLILGPKCYRRRPSRTLPGRSRSLPDAPGTGYFICNFTYNGAPQGHFICKFTYNGAPQGDFICKFTYNGTPQGDFIRKITYNVAPQGDFICKFTYNGAPQGDLYVNLRTMELSRVENASVVALKTGKWEGGFCSIQFLFKFNVFVAFLIPVRGGALEIGWGHLSQPPGRFPGRLPGRHPGRRLG